MPGYASTSGNVGFGPLNEMMVPDTTQRFTLGAVQDAVDPWFGYGRFVYLAYPASGAIAPGRVLIVNTVDDYANARFTVADMPNTASTSYPIMVARQNVASVASVQYGWVQIEGVCPVQCSASIAAGAAPGITAAGKIGAYSTLKGIVGLRVLQPSTFTITKVGNTVNGSPVISVSNVDGLFVGLTPSGTGVAAGTISAIDSSGRNFTNSANCTATGSVTVTFTYTGFLLCHINTPGCSSAVA